MKLPLARRISSLAVVAVVASGCGGASSEEVTAGPAMTDLAPSYDASPSGAPGRAQRGDRKTRERAAGSQDRTGKSAAGPSTLRSGSKTISSPSPSGDTEPEPTRARQVGSPDPAVRVADPTGDLDRGVETAPSSADIVAVELTRAGGTIEVRTTFAAAVPTRMNGDKGMNVASFYDVDGNGIIDYEVWASLADNGWGTGHLDRREEKASFGPSSGITVTVEGHTLITRFPVERVGGAKSFRWSAASEWGTYESMAASTSARDYAPDEGAVGYPG